MILASFVFCTHTWKHAAASSALSASHNSDNTYTHCIFPAHLLAARATFGRTLVLEWYTGEEQGLVGSRALARERAQRGDNVIGQIQQDMTALRLSQDPMGLAFVQSSSATDPTLTRYVQDVAEQYADSSLILFNQVISGSSCCSDHQSYRENGYPSVGLIEPRGYTGMLCMSWLHHCLPGWLVHIDMGL